MDAAEAAYHLCICCCNRFGTEFDPDKALTWMLHSANSGSIKAQAEAMQLFNALRRDIPKDLENDITAWLTKATMAGSQLAATELEKWDPEVFRSARTIFRHRFANVDKEMFDNWDIPRLRDIIRANATHVDELIVNERGHRLLHCAAACGRLDMVQMLMDIGGDVNVLNDKTKHRYSVPFAQDIRK